MKRSKIDAIIHEAVDFLRSQNFWLPPFAFWTPDDWAKKGDEADEIRECMLGWDITDFGSGDFARTGLVIFTIRNGHMTDSRYQDKTYCEKILIVSENQVTPMHFHSAKMEDIINRAGGNLVIQFYDSTDDEGLSEAPVTLSVDGVQKTIAAGTKLILTPGESVCIPPRLYHKFWAEEGKGMALVGEVSKINDDNIDNRFFKKIGRFPVIEEDVPPRYLLFADCAK